MGEITIRLALQTHGAELSSHVAIRGGFIKGGLPYTSHFGGHKEGQHALDGIKGNVQISTTWLKSYKGVKLRIHLNMCGGDSWNKSFERTHQCWRLCIHKVAPEHLQVYFGHC